MRKTVPVALALFLLAGCADGPRSEPMVREAAQHDDAIRTVVVVKVWDMVEDPLDSPRDIFVSHYLDVDVIAGPGTGRPLCLPFDRRYAGIAVPKPGDRLVLAPADLVPRAPDRKRREDPASMR